MTDGPLLAAIDVGTTRVKAGIYEPDGRVLAAAAVPAPTRACGPGQAEYDAEALWDAASAAMRDAVGGVEEPARIASVAVASMAEAGVPLDRSGKPTAAVIAWFDRRSADQGRRLAAAVGADRLRNLTGLPPQPIYGICKLAWLGDHAPDAFARTRVWLNVADYIAYRLSGEQATDFSLATRTGALDLRARQWSREVLDAAGVPATLFPPLLPSGSALGRVTSAAVRVTGLPPHTVVGTGGHDHVCGALAAGVVEPGRALDSMGTAESLLLPLTAPLATDERTPRFSQGAHVAADRWYAAKGIHAAGASIDWALRLLGTDAHPGELLAEAADVPAGAHGVIFTPQMSLPDGAGGEHAALVGLTPDTDRATLVRAVLEGLAVEASDVLDRLVAHAGLRSPPQVRVIGGGTRHALLLAIKAAVGGRSLHRLDLTEATSLGAALLGGVASGVFPDAAAAAAGIRTELREIVADPAEITAYEDPARRARALRDLAG